MSFFAGDNLRAIISGRWLQRPADVDDPAGVGTDTRQDLKGKVFIAIRGEHFDGHDYLAQAADRGAMMAIVEHSMPAADLPGAMGLLLVSDTRRALARMALAYRRSLSAAKVIAITGSSGKTTTKRLIDAVLSGALPGRAAPKSFNNDIGVPLTILGARPQDRYLVVEIGTNAPGEVGHLARIAEPDIAVITNIGRAHLEGFGSIEAIAREKASLLSHLSPDGTAVINADTPHLAPYVRAVPTAIRFGESAEADLRLTARGRHVPAQRGGWFEVNGRLRFDLSLPGRHNAINALAAVAIGRRFALEDGQISAALAAVEPEPMRMVEQHVAGLVFYNDTYNANPDSVAAALETFIEVAADAPRRVVILGDMLELGNAGPDLHREVGRRILDLDRQVRIDHALLIGPLAAHIADVLSGAWPPSRFSVVRAMNEKAQRLAARLLQPGDTVLVKASRGLGLERLVEAVAPDTPAEPGHRPPCIEIAPPSAAGATRACLEAPGAG
jgi:UDP-N-acetylmuramoyl-tripeptide--D-alanyl-D-alanine ligase